MDISLPSRDALKAQAKRLRAGLETQGQPITHAQALEAVAHQWGARDWNTLAARAGQAPQPRYAPDARVSGRYLGHRFTGRIKSARHNTDDTWSLTLRFDAPIDVVASAHFSSYRRQVNCVVDGAGRTARKTSDGQPHVVLDDHWSA